MTRAVKRDIAAAVFLALTGQFGDGGSDALERVVEPSQPVTEGAARWRGARLPTDRDRRATGLHGEAGFEHHLGELDELAPGAPRPARSDRLQMSIVSSSRRPRDAKSTPAAANSVSSQPAPKPASALPFETMSSVWKARAAVRGSAAAGEVDVRPEADVRGQAGQMAQVAGRVVDRDVRRHRRMVFARER